VLITACAARGLLRSLPPARSLLLAVAGGVAMSLNWALLFAAYRHATISVATVVYNLQPFILVLLGQLVFGERPGRRVIGWLAVALAGTALVATGRPVTGGGDDQALGILLGFGAAGCWAVAATTTKHLRGVPPQLVALIHLGVGASVFAPFAGQAGLPGSAGAWAALGTIGVVHTGLMYLLMYAAVQRLTASVQGAVSFLSPAAAIAVDLLAFGMAPSPGQVAGAVAVLAAAAAVSLGSGAEAAECRPR
jgi:RarD protein